MQTIDKMLVVDLEMSCWESKQAPVGEQQEIIEIGYCVIDLSTMRRELPCSVKIRPQRSAISKYCTELTGWTERSLKSGQYLQDACKTLIYKRGFRRMAWTSWGTGDLAVMRAQTHELNAEYPFGSTYFDVSALYSLTYAQPIKTGLGVALDHLGIKPRGARHVGANDAYDTAGIMIKILERSCVCAI